MLNTLTHSSGLATMSMVGAASFSMLMPTATADWPTIVDAMPNDAQAVICTQPLLDVDDHWDDFIAAIDFGGLGMMPGPLSALEMFGMDLDSMDFSRSAGLAVFKDRWDGDVPPILVFVPVSHYDNWVGSFESFPVEGDIQKIGFVDGEQWFVKGVDGFAVCGLDQELVVDYKAAGDGGKWQQLIGTQGKKVVGRNDISVMVDFDGLDEVLKPAMNEMFKDLSEQMAMGMSMSGGDPAQAEEMIAAYKAIIDLVFEQGSGGTVGVNFSDLGASFDLGVQWKEDSAIAAAFPGTDNPANFLNHFVMDPFMFAVTMDLTAFDMDALETTFGNGAFASLMAGTPGMDTAMDLWKNAGGGAMTAYVSPGGLTGGLLNSSATFIRGDTDKLMSGMQEMMTSMNDQEVQGITYETAYDAGVTEVGGVAVDSYTMKMNMPANMMGANQAIGMMYGPAGLRGFVAPTKDGIFQTVGQNRVLLQKLIAASKGDGKTLNESKMLASVDKMLSADPVMRGYFGLGPVGAQFAPMAGMFLPNLDVDAAMLTELPPIGMSMSVSDGGFSLSFATPAPLIKKVGEISMSVQGGMGGGGEPGDNQDEEEPPLF